MIESFDNPSDVDRALDRARRQLQAFEDSVDRKRLLERLQAASPAHPVLLARAAFLVFTVLPVVLALVAILAPFMLSALGASGQEWAVDFNRQLARVDEVVPVPDGLPGIPTMFMVVAVCMFVGWVTTTFAALAIGRETSMMPWEAREHQKLVNEITRLTTQKAVIARINQNTPRGGRPTVGTPVPLSLRDRGTAPPAASAFGGSLVGSPGLARGALGGGAPVAAPSAGPARTGGLRPEPPPGQRASYGGGLLGAAPPVIPARPSNDVPRQPPARGGALARSGTGPGAPERESYRPGLGLGPRGRRPEPVASARGETGPLGSPLGAPREPLGGLAGGASALGARGGLSSGERASHGSGERPARGGLGGERPSLGGGTSGERPAFGGLGGARGALGGRGSGDRPTYGGAAGERPAYGRSRASGERPAFGGLGRDRSDQGEPRPGLGVGRALGSAPAVDSSRALGARPGGVGGSALGQPPRAGRPLGERSRSRLAGPAGSGASVISGDNAGAPSVFPGTPGGAPPRRSDPDHDDSRDSFDLFGPSDGSSRQPQAAPNTLRLATRAQRVPSGQTAEPVPDIVEDSPYISGEIASTRSTKITTRLPRWGRIDEPWLEDVIQKAEALALEFPVQAHLEFSQEEHLPFTLVIARATPAMAVRCMVSYVEFLAAIPTPPLARIELVNVPNLDLNFHRNVKAALDPYFQDGVEVEPEPGRIDIMFLAPDPGWQSFPRLPMK